MGYIKVVQYGDTTVKYEYEKNRNNNKKPQLSLKIKEKDIRHAIKKRKNPPSKIKLNRNKKRARDNFFMLCHENNCKSKTIHFLTLTFIQDLTYKKANRYVSEFFKKIKQNFKTIPISYISVPELTKKGRYHFHLLVYNLPTTQAKNERQTRNFQRQFTRGYVDLRIAEYNSEGIAGYMAKYMAKTLSDTKHEARRAYNCSRNIDKIRIYSSNTLVEYMDMILTGDCIQTNTYEVPFMGKCLKTKYKNNVNSIKS